MKVYLAGPMESVGGNFNFPLFDHVTTRLRGAGFDVFNPAEHAREVLGPLEIIQKMDKKALRTAIRQALLPVELDWICKEANALLLLAGWQQSGGARLERDLALLLEIPVHELPTIIVPDWNPVLDLSIES